MCCSGVCQLVYPLFNSPLLFVVECLRCLQVMVGRCYADIVVLERLLRSARLQFGMLLVGVEKSRIMAIFHAPAPLFVFFVDARTGCGTSASSSSQDGASIGRWSFFAATEEVSVCLGLIERWGFCWRSVWIASVPVSLTLLLFLSFCWVGIWREQLISAGFHPGAC